MTIREEYEHHRETVRSPLPYNEFVSLFRELESIQLTDDYRSGRELPVGVEERSLWLCNRLGY